MTLVPVADMRGNREQDVRGRGRGRGRGRRTCAATASRMCG